MSDPSQVDEAPSLARAIHKVMARLLPFLLLMYVLAFLDRANIGFAQHALREERGISDAAFALGAGIFFIGYALLEVPSNLVLHRVGARIWMCRIMVTWGIVSAMMAVVTSTNTFYLLRFLLGAAEAGFFPGIIFYLSNWFPQSARARAIGVFYFGAPLAFIVGGPLSGSLLDLHGAAGIAGWQWMFIVEGLLASIVGVWAFRFLQDCPNDARWLADDEKRALNEALAHDAQAAAMHGPRNVAAALTNGRVLAFALIYALIQMSVYGVIFFLPQQVGALLGKRVGFEVGVIGAIPWLCAIVVTWFVPRRADRTGGHRLLAVAMLAIAGIGIGLSGVATNPVIAMIGLCAAASGFIAAQPLFWTFPSRYLTGAAAAGGIALINSLGSLGGFFAPALRAWADRVFASHAAGLEALALASLAGAALIAIVVPRVGFGAGAYDQPVERLR